MGILIFNFELVALSVALFKLFKRRQLGSLPLNVKIIFGALFLFVITSIVQWIYLVVVDTGNDIVYLFKFEG